MQESCNNAIESLKKVRGERRLLTGMELIKDSYELKKKREIKQKYDKYKQELPSLPYRIDANKKKEKYGYRDVKSLKRLMTPRTTNKKES